MQVTFSSPFRRMILVSAVCGGLVPSVASAEQTMIVFDASGSMWGQIDGKTKIEIARDTMRDVLGKVPPGTALGLTAYGHRQKGNCADIEVILPPEAGTGARIADIVGRINPKGKTPLSQAVRQAAEAMKYTEAKATVILVTDGIETCDADPCALGEELARLGVDFTAHVVGFGLSDAEGRQVACLAEATGGSYLDARNASDLETALSQTVAAPAEPPAPASLPTATISVPDEVPQGTRFEIAYEGPNGRYDDIHIALDRMDDGKYLRTVRIDPDGAPLRAVAPADIGEYELRYWYREGGAVIGRATLNVVEAAVLFDAPETVEQGTRVRVGWKGPGAPRDDIQIARPGAEPTRYLFTARVPSDGGPVTLDVPVELGDYELRYYSTVDGVILGTAPITVVEKAIVITPPEAVEAGTVFNVAWDGPASPRDDIQLAAIGADPGKHLDTVRVRSDGKPVRLNAPVEPGDYELRYWSGASREVLHTVGLTVMPVLVELDAPDEIEGGTRFKVTWEGPGAPRDDIQIARPGDDAGKHLFTVRVPQDRKPVTLDSPVEPGDYELRYWSGAGREVLAMRPIRIMAPTVSIEAPDSAEGGRRIRIGWTGPGTPRDDIQIARPSDEDGKAIHSTRITQDRKPLLLQMPVEAGDYELRYWTAPTRTVLHRVPITVVAPQVTMKPAGPVKAGATFTVEWTGPGESRDDIQVSKPGSDPGAHETTIRVTSDGRPVKLKAPAAPGTYELRYWSGPNRTVVETVPITVD